MKVSIIGIGRVGSTVAYTIVLRGLAKGLVLVNRTRATAVGEAHDLSHTLSLTDHQMTIRAGDARDTEGSDLIVLCLSDGSVRDAANRLDMAAANAALFKKELPPLVAASPQACLLVVTNPVDVLTYLALRISQFDPKRVFGTGTLIDSARFRHLLSKDLGVHPDDVRAYIIGEHGDSQFPILSGATFGGEPVPPHEATIKHFEDTVRLGGQVMRHKGYTNYAIAAAAGLIVESMYADALRTIPVSTLIDGFQGVRDVCLSVPVVIGRGGIVRQLRPSLDEREAAAFRRSAALVRAVIEQVV